MTSPTDCGNCGKACSIGGVCNAGTCGCPANLPNPCAGPPATCVNFTNDSFNCGGRGVVASPGSTCQTMGNPAVTACVCGANLTNCPNNGGCVNESSDPN